ncbi:MAG: RDD family protein, partial [Candidatus Angelobacter sp.]
VVDAGIVFIGCGIFAATFMKLAEEIPQSRLIGVCTLAVGGAFWLIFQYLFLVYGRATPGMRMVQLELCNFEGKRATLFERQCRALASTLSGFSAGLGYAWALVDEDRLGWHDRISQTHLKSLPAIPSGAKEPYYYDDLKG